MAPPKSRALSKPAKQASSIQPGALAPGNSFEYKFEPALLGESLSYESCRPFHGLMKITPLDLGLTPQALCSAPASQASAFCARARCSVIRAAPGYRSWSGFLFRATARWFSAALGEVARSVGQLEAFVCGTDDLDVDFAVRPIAGLVRR